MICRPVSWHELIHTEACSSHKGVPTRHCVCIRSDAASNYLKYIMKSACLFFDQVNNYGKLRCAKPRGWQPSTDLCTAFVDNMSVLVLQTAPRSCPIRRGPISCSARSIRLHFAPKLTGNQAWRCLETTA